MPALANIIVKKNDGATDVTFTATQPGTGESPAIYYAPALGATPATRPEFRISSKMVGGGKFKKVTGTVMYPESAVNTTTGLTSIVNRVMFKFEGTMPAETPQSIIDEGVSQAVNLAASTQFKSSCKEGFAPA
jgi:hypothetical protein